MPVEFRTFFEMFRLAFRDETSPQRRKVLRILLFVFPLMIMMNTLCLLLDRVFFPGYRKVRVKSPIFIIGHARSGTTLMHRLLTSDRERFSWFMTYELFLPSLVQKKLIRFLGELDRRYWGARIDRRIKSWEDRTFAKGRQMHPMSLTNPEEDEFVLMFTGLSGTLAMFFPYMRELQRLSRLDEASPEQRSRTLGFYRACVQRQLYLNGVDKIHLSKNPSFSAKVESLSEAFPDARFIVLLRDPTQTIPSLLKMMVRNWKAVGCTRERMDDSLAVLTDHSIQAYLHPFEVLERHGETPYAVVDYERLVESPKQVVEEVYQELGLDVSPELARALEREEARSRDHRADHIYSLDEFGLTRAQIRERLKPLFDRYGWDV